MIALAISPQALTPSVLFSIGGKLRRVYPGTDLRAGARVYLIEAGASGKVKIGTSVCVQKRLSQLQGASPEKMRLLLSMDGGLREEAEVQAAYKAERIHREWFSRSGDLERFIDSVFWAFGQIDAARHLTTEAP